jgi:hypothetical protein
VDIVFPLTLPLLAIHMFDFSLAVHLVSLKRPSVYGAIRLLEFTNSMFSVLDILAFIILSILPRLHTIAMHLAIQEVSIVDFGSITPLITARSIQLIFFPLAFEYISFIIDESAIPMMHIISPHAIISATALSKSDSSSTFHAIEPFAFIYRFIMRIAEDGLENSNLLILNIAFFPLKRMDLANITIKIFLI